MPTSSSKQYVGAYFPQSELIFEAAWAPTLTYDSYCFMHISCAITEDGKVVVTESNHEEVILVMCWQQFKDEHKIEGGYLGCGFGKYAFQVCSPSLTLEVD